MIKVNVENGASLGRYDPKDKKSYTAAGLVLQQLLDAVDAPQGLYTATSVKQCRWQGGRDKVPYKVSRFEHRSVYITVRPLTCGNDGVFEYALRGDFANWDERQLYFSIRDYIEAQHAAIVAEKATPAIPTNGHSPPVEVVRKLSVLERIANLEATAQRNDARNNELVMLQQDKLQLLAQRESLTSQIARMEARELDIMEEIENDEECRSAQQSLAALEALLG